MAKCVNIGNKNVQGNNDDDKDNNNDDNDSIDNSIVHPLFMNSLPHDFSTNPHLSALASFITNHDDDNDDDEDDDEEDNIRSNSRISSNNNNINSNNDEINDTNDDNDNFNDNMNMQEIHLDHHDTAVPNTMLKQMTTSSTSTQQSILTSNRVKLEIPSSGGGGHGGGKVKSGMHWKSRQLGKPYQRSDDVRKKDLNKKKNDKKTTTTTTLPEAQLFLKMWKL